MDFAYTDEQSMLLDTCERLVRERCGFEQRREHARKGAHEAPPLWSDYAQLGLTGIVVPEAEGGMQRPLIDGVLVAQALGRGWLLEPFVDCALAAATMLSRVEKSTAGDTALAAIATGARIIVPLFEASFEAEHARGVAPHASYADAVLALNGDRLQLLIATEARRSGWRQFDGLAAAEIECPAGSAAVTLASGEPAKQAWKAGHKVARIGRIAEGIGLANTVLDLTSEYLRTRKQFGQPIGRFQALAHRMADLQLRFEMAQSLMLAAVMKLDGAEAEHTLGAAQVLAHRTLRAIGQEAIQLHGGIGMTDEYAVSHYVKRLLGIEIELGDVDTTLMRFAAAA